jgi:hypothetical protein
VEKWQREKANRLADKANIAALARVLAIDRTPTKLAALATQAEWRPDERLARGSAHTVTRKAHQMCGGGCGAPAGTPGHEGHQRGCGTHSAGKCGGRYFAARTSINFCKGDASLKVALGKKRQARINARGW